MSMTKRTEFDTVRLIGAPTAMQPGGYVPQAYQDRRQPLTPVVDIAATRNGNRWVVELRWDCPNPVQSSAGETDLFTDAAAVLVPGTMNAPWLTMGAPEEPVEAALWRADQNRLFKMRAEGLGSMVRSTPPEHWSVAASWEDGRWYLRYEFGEWPVLNQFGRLGVAIWRGESQDRGGLKSVTGYWVTLR